MNQVTFTVQRHVPASSRPNGPEDRSIAMVLFHMPGETVGRTLAISEDQIRFEAGGDPVKEDAVIRRELGNVIAQMTAGAIQPFG